MALFRGEGGGVFEIDEPLPKAFAEQVRKHLLVPVESEDDPRVAVSEPSKTDGKAAWVDFAVAHGQSRKDADAMTKAELVEKFGG